MDPSGSSVGLAVLDQMIRETAGGSTAMVQAAVDKDPGFSPTWAKVGAEMGVGIRLLILKEARDRILTAELKAREKVA